ncbi:MAG: cupredoxin domain-containing protein, partial [Sweet potato little leaf phytoplasma]|nr:cupredoxin domain-containing protein [Sweet potato little leaf phytoplasma]
AGPLLGMFFSSIKSTLPHHQRYPFSPSVQRKDCLIQFPHSPSSNTKEQTPPPTTNMHFSTYTLLAPTVLISLSQAKNIDIIVGKSGLTFEPNSTTADEGDTLTFKFWPKAHSVVQGAFDSPCTPIDTGFNSDFVPVESGAANRTFVVTVNNTNPIWYYCSQGKHCQNGMVGVINPP